MSQIYSIVYRPDGVEEKPDDHFSRVPLQETALIAGYGIEGDRKGGHPDRHLNIMSYEALAQIAEKGFKVAPGQMGEQIIVTGIDVMTLPSGSHVQIGDAAVFEVVKTRSGCDRFEHIQGKPREEAASSIGVMARVIVSGTIRVGDTVRVLQEA